MMQKRGTLKVLLNLIALVKPLTPIMCVAVVAGCIGYFCATSITVLGSYAILQVVNNADSVIAILVALAVVAIMRGIVKYLEQYCNHYIAFKLLALIRDKVFKKLRTLAPANLNGANRGNLVSVITSDIELLEVFYAHTVSPIVIATITSCVVIAFISTFNILLGVIALIAHLTLGVVVPLLLSQKSNISGKINREKAGELNSYFLDCLRGIDEVLQFNCIKSREAGIDHLTADMEQSTKQIKLNTGKTMMLSNLIILSFSILMLLVSGFMYTNKMISMEAILIPTVTLFSSFGAVTATANLGAGLSQTIASGNRVLDLLDENPLVEPVTNGIDVNFDSAEFDNITFAYDQQTIVKDFSLKIEKNRVIGISGKSGSGKSTILKLLMRFWDVDKGCITISGKDVRDINTQCLRKTQSFVTQETHLFHDTISQNIRLANLNATQAQIEEACKKASVHDFIMSLPNGYDTEVGELGDTLSGGERQRIGIARAFLHNADLILLDEPTSNLDSLNEGVVLRSISKIKDKTVMLVSHRCSTMRIASQVINLEGERNS